MKSEARRTAVRAPPPTHTRAARARRESAAPPGTPARNPAIPVRLQNVAATARNADGSHVPRTNSSPAQIRRTTGTAKSNGAWRGAPFKAGTSNAANVAVAPEASAPSVTFRRSPCDNLTSRLWAPHVVAVNAHSAAGWRGSILASVGPLGHSGSASATTPGVNGRISFMRSDDNGHWQIWTANPDLTAQHQLTERRLRQRLGDVVTRRHPTRVRLGAPRARSQRRPQGDLHDGTGRE